MITFEFCYQQLDSEMLNIYFKVIKVVKQVLTLKSLFVCESWEMFGASADDSWLTDDCLNLIWPSVPRI